MTDSTAYSDYMYSKVYKHFNSNYISAVDGKHRMRYTASIRGFPLSGRFRTGGHTVCEQNAVL